MVLKDESYDLLTTKQRESKQTSNGFCFLVRLGCAYFSGSSFSAWFQLHVELLTHMSHILKNISFLCFSDATCAVRGVYIYYTYCGQEPTCTEAAGYKCSHVKYRLLQGQRSHATVTTCFFYQVRGAQLKAYLGEQWQKRKDILCLCVFVCALVRGVGICVRDYETHHDTTNHVTSKQSRYCLQGTLKKIRDGISSSANRSTTLRLKKLPSATCCLWISIFFKMHVCELECDMLRL